MNLLGKVLMLISTKAWNVQLQEWTFCLSHVRDLNFDITYGLPIVFFLIMSGMLILSFCFALYMMKGTYYVSRQFCIPHEFANCVVSWIVFFWHTLSVSSSRRKQNRNFPLLMGCALRQVVCFVPLCWLVVDTWTWPALPHSWAVPQPAYTCTNTCGQQTSSLFARTTLVQGLAPCLFITV